MVKCDPKSSQTFVWKLRGVGEAIVSISFPEETPLEVKEKMWEAFFKGLLAIVAKH